MKNRYLPFWILTVAIMLGLTLPVLVQDGMFGDAVLYTCVSRNLSIGNGTFWFPQYSTLNVGGLSSFHEHPPLAFGIQSLLFLLLGDHIYVERLYVFMTFLIAAILIIFIWNTHFKEHKHLRKYVWVAFILWISSPVVFWTYSNNMQENTLSIFCLAAVLCYVINYRLKETKTIYFILAGIFVFLATLTKGIPGFFPLAIPLIHWVVFRKEKLWKALLNTVIVAAVPALIYTLLLQIPEVKESLYMYFFERLLHRVQQDPTTNYRWYSLVRTISELIPSFIILAIIMGIAYYKKQISTVSFETKSIVFFLLIGLAYISPLMITMVQKGMYLSPGFPYFAMALSLVIIPYIDGWIGNIKVSSVGFKIFLVSSILLLGAVGVFSFTRAGKIPASQSLIRDIYKIGKVIPPNSTVTIPQGMYYDNDFVMPGYLMRYDRISLSPYKQYEFYLQDKGYPALDTLHFKKISLQTEKLDIYKFVR